MYYCWLIQRCLFIFREISCRQKCSFPRKTYCTKSHQSRKKPFCEKFPILQIFSHKFGPLSYLTLRGFCVCLFVTDSFAKSNIFSFPRRFSYTCGGLAKLWKQKYTFQPYFWSSCPFFSVILLHFGEYLRCRNLFTTSEKRSGIVWSCNDCGFCVTKSWITIVQRPNIKQMIIVVLKMFWTVH